jgi:purine catabolism regulator
MASIVDVLALQALDLTALHLPQPDVEVRWVATSELEDPTPFLEGGELLLTTGLATVGWRRQWDAYAERLAASGVSALGLAAGLTHRRPPTGLVRACERSGLNLIVVPDTTTFVAISRATARLLESNDELAARDALAVQQQLTQAALRVDDVDALIKQLARIVQGGVCVVQPDGRLTGGPVGPRSDALDVALVAAEVSRIRSKGLRAASSFAVPGGTTLVQPLGLRGRPTAYVAVTLVGRPTESRRAAVATAVALLSLAAERSAAEQQTRRQLRGRALELLVEGDVRAAGLVLAAAEGTRADDQRLPGRAALVRARGAGELSGDLVAMVEGTSELTGLVENELWVLVASSRRSAVAESLAECGLVVGVGEVVPLPETSRSHATAGHALAQASSGAPVVWWDRLVGEGAMSLIDSTRARDFAASFLAPLAGESEEELRVTLQAFLKHHGSRLKIAEELAVHRNTVRNRIDQVEQLLGRSLDDPQVRVSAWVAFQALLDDTAPTN